MNKELKVKLGVFRNDRRAFYSFIVLATLFVLTLPAEILCNIRPLIIVVDGKPYFPIAVTYSEKDFGGSLPSEPDYKSQSFSNLLSGTSTLTPINTNSSGLGLDLGDFEDDEGDLDISPMPSTNNIEISPKSFWMLWPPVRYDYKYIPTESITGNVVLAAPYKTKSPIGQGFIESS
ncbi:MAG: ABC-type microcin C transport system permease subunit YejE, partial [Nitrospinales bacterium]